jgi:ParB family chromosome partitioning protein
MNTTTVISTVTDTPIQAVADDKALHTTAQQQAQTVLDKAHASAQASGNINDTASSQAEQDSQEPAELRFISLSRLRISKSNVRKTSTVPVDALAESIVRVGLLQNLIVIALPGGLYGVVGGKRRLAALRLLAQQKRIGKDQSIPCLVVPDGSAVTVSLTENVQREAMHPADQFEAFMALVTEGRPVEDIAADFSVTPLVVLRRLKLAKVSPRLLADYRAGNVTLDQLMALAITEDHKAQEAAFYDAPQHEREAYALRRRITHSEVDASRNVLARFVGMEAYEATGGGIRRDLFAEDGQGVYLTDAGLLHRLAMAKLDAFTAEIRAEGWKWVDAIPAIGYSELAAFRRAQQTERQPRAREAKRLVKLQAAQARIEEALHAAEEAEDEAAATKLYEQGDRVGEALDALFASLLVYTPETMAASGVIVTVDREGELTVHRGLLRPEDVKATAQAAKTPPVEGADNESESGDADDNPAPGKTLSDRLSRNLSAHRTAALQAELARKPDVALVALTHRLALSVFYHDSRASLLQLSVHPQDGLERHAPELAQGKAAADFDALRSMWRDRLPDQADELFDALRQLKRADLLALLAVCTASMIDAVTSDEHDTRADTLARAVALDMTAYWKPSAERYFNHVSKAHILAGFKAFKPGEISRVSGYKKALMAGEAGQHATASGWLPAMLQTPA